MEALLQMFNTVLDWLYFGLISPAFQLLGQGLEFVLVKPLAVLHVPVTTQVVLFAMLTALLSFAIRHILKVDVLNRKFTKEFIEKRKKQKNISLLRDWKSRDAMYRATDRDLDEDFNTYLAQRYGHFVMTYLLPVLLILAWLNNVFSSDKMMSLYGRPYLVDLAGNGGNIEGLSVTFVFLVSYAVCLFIGFRIKKIRANNEVVGIHH